MSARQLRLVAPHNNQQLFSDYYLNETLPQHPMWRALRAEAKPVKAVIAGILAKYTPSTNEAQTERDLVRPVLEALGHIFEVQVALKTPGGTKTPDYVFYWNEAGRQANKNIVVSDEQLRATAYAVGDAKYWDRNLDVSLKSNSGDPFSNRNPSYQIAFYMQHSGVEWGILTNGRLWRLYNRATAHKLDRFYEVDLRELLDSGDPDQFLYFYAFFRRGAFEPGGFGVAEILKESADYARGVSDKLKLQVFEALRHLAQGFLDHPANNLQPTEETLTSIYDNALILLYRMLFVLYAEARELLPVRDNRAYRESYSLYALTHQTAENLRQGNHLLPTTAMIWPRLAALFQIIDAGSPPLNVATFNGGLFDPARHPFLEQYRVGDAHLQQAIDIVARVDGEFVDYRDLAEYHLGSIYEGLLEYHLIAGEPEDGWTIALVNEKGERKRTGSYYTPNYIVKYIVEHTVGPLLQEVIAGKASDQAKIDAVLDVNVLDPAMGSGYFLVEATEFIARFLVDQAFAPVGDGGDEPDLAYWKRRVVQSCIYGVDINPLAVDLAKLSLWLGTIAKDRPLSFLDHHLRVGNSVVGARIAELRQFDATPKTKRKAGRKAVAGGETQISMLDNDLFRQSMSTAVDSMWLIERSAGNTVEDVKQQEQVYAELHASLVRRYGRLADLVTATHFGLEIDPAFWTPLADFATGRSIAALPKLAEWLNNAELLAAQHRFFHWELEFPEVFFNQHGEPRGERSGFDAVIGNPPYVRQERLKPYKPYFQQMFSDIYHGVADLYVYFCHRGISLLRIGGRLGYITSGTFRKLDFGSPLRSFIGSKTTILEIVEFGEEQIFSQATTYPLMLMLENSQPHPGDEFNLRPFADLFGGGKPERKPLPKGNEIWVFTRAGLEHLITGWPGSQPLADFLADDIFRGITTGRNEAFVVSRETRDNIAKNDPASRPIMKPYVRGEDLQRWYPESHDLWLIFTRRGIDIDLYPGVKAYLERFREALEPKPVDWPDAAEWIGRKAGDYKWFEIQDSSTYYAAFERPRIHSTKVSLHPSFCLVDEPLYAANTSYVLPLSADSWASYLLGILNSRVSEYFSRQVFSAKANGYYEVQPKKLSTFPIPVASDKVADSVADLAAQVTQQAQYRYQRESQARQRILTDLGSPGGKLNNKLTAWWELDFSQFRAEIQKVFKREIPLRERDEWEEWLNERRAEHERYTAEIIRLETTLNEHVYALFDLTPAEIKLIEESTKYRYGEV